MLIAPSPRLPRQDLKLPLIAFLIRNGYGLDGEAEIVGDILPAHRQRDRHRGCADPGIARLQVQQKGGYLLFRGFASQQQHLVLRQAEFMAGEFVQPAQQMRLAIDIGEKRRPREPADPNLRHGFCRDAVSVHQRQTEEIAGQGKADDLATSVRQRFVQPHHSFGDVEHAVRQRALIEQHGLGREIPDVAQPVEFVQFRRLQRAADAEQPHLAVVAIIATAPVFAIARRRSGAGFSQWLDEGHGVSPLDSVTQYNTPGSMIGVIDPDQCQSGRHPPVYRPSGIRQ